MHKIFTSRPFSTPPAFTTRRLSSLFSSYFSRTKSKRATYCHAYSTSTPTATSTASSSFVSTPSSPLSAMSQPQLQPRPRPIRPPRPIDYHTFTPTHQRRAVPIQQKREVLLKTVSRDKDLPKETLQGLRHILASAIPYVYVVGSFLMILLSS